MRFVIRITNLPEVQQQLAQLPARLHRRTRSIVETALKQLHTTMIKRSSQGPLHARTGKLAKSWVMRTQSTGDTHFSAHVASEGVPYAITHELGGTIRPKRGKWLTIPLSSNKGGTLSMQAVLDQGGYVQTSRRGNRIVFDAQGIPMFVLKKQIHIPPRLGFREAATETMRTIVKRLHTLLDNTP